MFKALLKTIPTLSGNMKLSCFVENYTRLNKSQYIGNIQTAKLTPISHNVYDANIFVNLKNNAYEYDIKNFYRKYLDIFYKSNYNYSKVNIPVLDTSKILDDSNIDFQYGCKRISYTKYKNQLAFFCPIYVEGYEDIKDKYFKITCIFHKLNYLKKELIIHLSSNDNTDNYLIDYLERYTKQIDDNVIYMSNSYKNIYYGIDVLNGGFIKVEDNISNNLYNKYYTINDFDATINFGFKRNLMVMKQIIPLCFYFNPNELLTDIEKQLYKEADISISGNWYTKVDDKNDIHEKFYNFSDNYTYFTENIYQLNSSNIFHYNFSNKNIMSMNYPAFKEAESENYKYINTVIKNYNRWKMKYSSDNNPYIINNNFAFSQNQNSLFNYKEYPIIYKPMKSLCKQDHGVYNMIFDLNDKLNDNSELVNNKQEYYNYFNQNYISSFFNIISEDENIFTNSKYWEKVFDDNKIYYKGILYDFNNLYQTYNMPHIDYFSVFVNPEMSNIMTNDKFNETYYSVKYLIDDNVINKIDPEIYSYEFISSHSNIKNNVIVYQNDNGDYVDVNSYSYYYLNDLGLHYNENNLYIDTDELLKHQKHQTPTIEILQNEYDIDIDLYEGYKILDINYKNNIWNNDKFIFNKEKFLQDDKIYKINENIFFSINDSSVKYNLFKHIDLFNSLTIGSKIVVYIKTKFITFNEFKQLRELLNKLPEPNKLKKYYITNGLYNKNGKYLYTDICFKELKDNDNEYGKFNFEELSKNIIYIDPYNLQNLYKQLFKEELSIQEIKDCYCNFLNYEHIFKYFSDLYKNETGEGDKDEKNIFIRLHYLNYENGYIYESLENNCLIDLFSDDSFNLFGISNLQEFISKYINYDELGYFYFNDDFINEDKLRNIEKIDKIDKILEYNHFELCFKKTMAKLTEPLYNLIMQIHQKGNIFKDLYLYRLYDNSDYKFEYLYQEDTNTIDQEDTNTIDVHINLYPYFNSIYNEEKHNTKIYNDYFLNNIIKCTEKNNNSYSNSYYKYNVYSIDYLVYCPITYNDTISYSYRYSLYDDNYDPLYRNDNSYSYLNIYSYNNITYGYYLLKPKFDNTKNTLNIYNYNNEPINVVSYINNIDVKKFKDSLTTYYHNLLPYINNSNIINSLFNRVSTIIKPSVSTLLNIYQQSPNIDINNECYSYYIFVGHQKNIQLLRYFDNIVPYIPESNNIITTYYLNYKENNNFIEYNLSIDQDISYHSYIMYQKNDNIYQNKKISYFKNENNKFTIKKYQPTEWKHFNNNKFYNLEKTIIIKYVGNEENGLLKYDDMMNIENDNKIIFGLFKKYLEGQNNTLSYNDILFLYNNYDVKFSHTIKSFHLNEDKKRDYDLYSLTIKYNLL